LAKQTQVMGETAFESQLFFIAAVVQFAMLIAFADLFEMDPSEDTCDLGWSGEVTIYLLSIGFFIHTLSEVIENKWAQAVIVVGSTGIAMGALPTSYWAAQEVDDCGKDVGGFWACVALIIAIKCLSCLVHLQRSFGGSEQQQVKGQEPEKAVGRWKLALRLFSVSCATAYIIFEIVLDNTVTTYFTRFYTFILIVAELYSALLAQKNGLILFLATVLVGGISTGFLVGTVVTVSIKSETWPYLPQLLIFLFGMGAESLLSIWDRKEEKQSENQYALLSTQENGWGKPQLQQQPQQKNARVNCLFSMIVWGALVCYCAMVIGLSVGITIALANDSECFKDPELCLKGGANSTSPLPSFSPSPSPTPALFLFE